MSLIDYCEHRHPAFSCRVCNDEIQLEAARLDGNQGSEVMTSDATKTCLHSWFQLSSSKDDALWRCRHCTAVTSTNPLEPEPTISPRLQVIAGLALPVKERALAGQLFLSLARLIETNGDHFLVGRHQAGPVLVVFDELVRERDTARVALKIQTDSRAEDARQFERDRDFLLRERDAWRKERDERDKLAAMRDETIKRMVAERDRARVVGETLTALYNESLTADAGELVKKLQACVIEIASGKTS